MYKIAFCLLLAAVVCPGYKLPETARIRRLSAKNYNKNEDKIRYPPVYPRPKTYATTEHVPTEGTTEEPQPEHREEIPHAIPTEAVLEAEINEIIEYIKHESEEKSSESEESSESQESEEAQQNEEPEIEELIHILETVASSESAEAEPQIVQEIQELTEELKEIEINHVQHPHEEVPVEAQVEEALRHHPHVVEMVIHEIEHEKEVHAEEESAIPTLFAETAVGVHQPEPVMDPFTHPHPAAALDFHPPAETASQDTHEAPQPVPSVESVKHITPGPKPHFKKPQYPNYVSKYQKPHPTPYPAVKPSGTLPPESDFSPSLETFLKNGPPNFFTQFQKSW